MWLQHLICARWFRQYVHCMQAINISYSSSTNTHPKKEDVCRCMLCIFSENSQSFPGHHCQFVPRSMTMSTASCCTLVMRRGHQPLFFFVWLAGKRIGSRWNGNTVKSTFYLLVLLLCYCRSSCKEFLC